MRKLDDVDKTQLKRVEAAWLKYRDANCDFVAISTKAECIRPMIEAMCLARYQQEPDYRIKESKSR